MSAIDKLHMLSVAKSI